MFRGNSHGDFLYSFSLDEDANKLALELNLGAATSCTSTISSPLEPHRPHRPTIDDLTIGPADTHGWCCWRDAPFVPPPGHSARWQPCLRPSPLRHLQPLSRLPQRGAGAWHTKSQNSKPAARIGVSGCPKSFLSVFPCSNRSNHWISHHAL